VVRLVLAGSLALAGAALAAVWQPVLALGAGAAITGALMVGLIRRGREPQGDWRSVRATALRDGHP
jgi:hypothetical protein